MKEIHSFYMKMFIYTMKIFIYSMKIYYHNAVNKNVSGYENVFILIYISILFRIYLMYWQSL